MKKQNVYVVYEHGADLRPFGSAQIRLLRPLTHPGLRDALDVQTSWDYSGEPADLVIIDRLWRPDVSIISARKLVDQIRRTGARLMYAVDDNFLDLPVASNGHWTRERRRVVEFFLQQADGLTVTTTALQQRFTEFNSNCRVIPNALDERLLVNRAPASIKTPFGQRPIVVGYMGTFTHDDDLQMILPAWRAVRENHAHDVEFQVIGAAERRETLEALRQLSVRMLTPRPEEVEYPLFMIWFSSRVCWDIAVAPLQNTPLNQCKSDIKFLDYSAIGAAGIYSRTTAYEASVRHLETGWLVENTVDAWVVAMEQAITQASLRGMIARNATQYLYRERILDRTAHFWLEAIGELLAPS